jgi:PII-like signaling protein
MMRIYIGENDKWNDKPLYEAIVNRLRAHDIAEVTVYRGILGYGTNRRIHEDAALSLSHDRPILLSIVDTEPKLQAFMPILDQMVQQGLVVLSDVRCHQVHPQPPERRAAGGSADMKLEGKAKMLRIHFGEDDKWQGKPLEAIVAKCRELDIAGATAFRGIQGYGASTLIHKSHLLWSSDRPIMVSVVDTQENINKLLPVLDEMVGEGLIAISDVEVIRYLHQEGVRSPAS